MKQHANYSARVMETRDHFKNGASLKSLKSRGKTIIFFVLFFFVSIIINAQVDKSQLKWTLKTDKKIKKAIDKALINGRDGDGLYVADIKDLSGYNFSAWQEMNQDFQYKLFLPTETYKNYKIIETKARKGNRYVVSSVQIKFIPEKEYNAFIDSYNKKKLGITDFDFTLLFFDTNGAYVAYKFIDDVTFEIQKKNISSIRIYDGYNISDYWKINILVYSEQVNKETVCFDQGYINVEVSNSYTTSYNRKIYIPKQTLEDRKKMFGVASSGNIYDILKYEEKYKKIDSKYPILQDRKHKMLFTTEFFDEQSEKYKNELYKNEKVTLVNMISSMMQKLKNNFTISEGEVKQLYAVNDRFSQYNKYGYDPDKTSTLVKQTSIFCTALDGVAREPTSYVSSAGILYGSFLNALGQPSKSMNKEAFKADQALLLKSADALEELYDQNAFGERELYDEVYKRLASKEKLMIDVYNKGVGEVKGHIGELIAELRNERITREIMCPKCEVDYSKSSEYKEGSFFTTEQPGKIVMKTGDITEFYQSGKIWTLRDGFLGIGKTTFDTYHEMINFFLEKCKDKYLCN